MFDAEDTLCVLQCNMVFFNFLIFIYFYFLFHFLFLVLQGGATGKNLTWYTLLPRFWSYGVCADFDRVVFASILLLPQKAVVE